MPDPVIVIDGKTYKNVGEMPPEVRARYEQAMRAFPRSQETSATSRPTEFNGEDGSLTVNSTKFVVNGKEYNSLEELPPEARARYEQAMDALDANRNGLPDFLEGMFGTPSQPSAPPAATTIPPRQPASSPPMPATPTISPDTTSGWMLVLLGGFLAVLCLLLAAGVWYFFLR